MQKEIECPCCRTNIICYPDYEHFKVFYECPVCGRFELGDIDRKIDIDENHLASYLFYNRFLRSDYSEYRYHTIRDKEFCDKYSKEFKEGNNVHGHPVHIDSEIVEGWYPKTFAEKVDKILAYLEKQSQHMGQIIHIRRSELLSLLFVDRKDTIGNKALGSVEYTWREKSIYYDEMMFMVKYLAGQSYIEYEDVGGEEPVLLVRLTPQGYANVEKSQKALAYNTNAFVAMQFGKETQRLRDCIKKGITDAGYRPVLIDEIEHNEFITPEIMKNIRDSKFVVVDLTHQNNGAYFEEGYAMGLGKPVIQLCKKDTKLHFDIAQKNTIIWEKESDLPKQLYNRIVATIE